ncbi:MAG: hypothetical protein PUP93_11345 [Rhizonema sp. NSF051]|nr:hypothetical protein [Rhizonema sp. NSF051]
MHSIAFSIELFVIFFSFLCWLFVAETELRTQTVLDNALSGEPGKKEMLEATNNSSTSSAYDLFKLTLTQEVIDEFYEFLKPQKVKFWGLQVNENVVSNDFLFCPFVEYLIQTKVYESIDINCNDHATFWTTQEINALSDSQLEGLDEVEKHCLELPSWVSQAIDMFDEILNHRSVIGLDVVNVVNQITGNSENESVVQGDHLAEKIKTLSLVQLRKVASRLKSHNIISADKKLSGKGIGKKFLNDLISDRLSANSEVIAEVVGQILNEA